MWIMYQKREEDSIKKKHDDDYVNQEEKFEEEDMEKLIQIKINLNELDDTINMV